MKQLLPLVLATTALAACGGGGSGGSGSGQQIKILGSSTVYPFSRAVAEDFQRANAGTSVIVSRAGPSGISWCSGVGADVPDASCFAAYDEEQYQAARSRRQSVIEVPSGSTA